MHWKVRGQPLLTNIDGLTCIKSHYNIKMFVTDETLVNLIITLREMKMAAPSCDV